MLISELLKGVEYKILQGSDNENVENISWDSRKATKGDLFICVKGRNVDRHDFALHAVEAGVTCLILERELEGIPSSINVMMVDNTREIMAKIANTFFGQPSEYMNIIGVTGSKGKTSVTGIIGKIFDMAGRKAGVIGTNGNKFADKEIEIEKINPTTPDSMELQAALKEMQDKGATEVVIEVTVPAMDDHRVDQCRFNIGVFTNLKQDHISEHGNFTSYKNTILKLFKLCRLGIVNADDQIYEDIKRSTNCKMLLTYGIKNEADFMAEDIKNTVNGTEFSLNYHGIHRRIFTKLSGEHNVYNILAAIGACHLAGLSLDQITKGIKKIDEVRG